MIEAIIQAIASLLSWAAVKGIDSLVGKWLAYFTIAFEEKASEKAKAAFSETISNIKKNMPEKAKAWDEWRKRATSSPNS